MNRRSLLTLSFATVFSSGHGRASAEPKTSTGSLQGQSSGQLIRIDAVDAARLRLTLQGKENWVVETGSLELRANGASVDVIAERGQNVVQLPDSSNVAETFQVSIRIDGGLSFHITNMKRQ